MPTADAPNQVWAVDLQFDQTTDGRPSRIAFRVDGHTRQRLGGLVARSITADIRSTEPDRIATVRGAAIWWDPAPATVASLLVATLGAG